LPARPRSSPPRASGACDEPTASSTPSTATPPTGRIDLLDVLSGVAILGTLGTNIWFFAINATQRDFDTGSDGVVQAISDAITNGKFLGMLTILFGVGLAIQHASAMRRRSRWPCSSCLLRPAARGTVLASP